MNFSLVLAWQGDLLPGVVSIIVLRERLDHPVVVAAMVLLSLASAEVVQFLIDGPLDVGLDGGLAVAEQLALQLLVGRYLHCVGYHVQVLRHHRRHIPVSELLLVAPEPPHLWLILHLAFWISSQSSQLHF